MAGGEDDRALPFEQDRDRILRSAPFQRLRGVTQVMAAATPGGFHNRQTHSLAVARIGRRLAATLLGRPAGRAAAEAAGGLDPTVVEAACLAHDLGHPPFGHAGERELDRLLTAAGVADGFEANAQTFRLVTRLAADAADIPGMNLTRATQAAILKYPWPRQALGNRAVKWGAYPAEAAELAWARARSSPGDGEPALEAALMDWADEIAYSILDFADFARAGLIPMPRLAADGRERDRLLELVVTRRGIPAAQHEELARALAHLLHRRPMAHADGNGRAGAAALRRFIAGSIDHAIEAVQIASDGARPGALQIDPAQEAEIILFEGLTRHYVIESPALVAARARQADLIRALFTNLADLALSGRELHRFPASWQGRTQAAASEPERLRAIADLISGMSEEQVAASYRRLTGRTFMSRPQQTL